MTNKTLIVTGAGKGIGRAIATLAVEQGHRVFGLSRDITALERNKNIEAISLDLTNGKAIAQFAAKFLSANIRVDALINNAGVLVNKPFEKTTIEDFHATFSVNLFALAMLTKALLPGIRKSGHVLNISSIGGVEGTHKFAGLAAYSSSKAAVNALTQLLAEEYSKSGPAFNVLALGAVQTSMLETAFPEYKAPLSPKDIAPFILDFALNQQKLFNGKIIPISSSTP